MLFLAAAVYAVGYLRRESRGAHRDFEEGLLFANAPEATFTGCLLLFLAAMTLVTVSRTSACSGWRSRRPRWRARR